MLELYSKNNKKHRTDFVCLVFADGIFQKDTSILGDLTEQIDLTDNIFHLNVPRNYNMLVRILNIKTNYTSPCIEESSFKSIKCSSGSKVTLLETFHGLDSFIYHNKNAMRVELEENSRVTIYNVVDEGNQGSHSGNLLISQKTNSCLETYRLFCRGDIISDNVVSFLLGERSNFQSMGLYMSTGKEFRIVSSKAHHMASNTKSNQSYNGIANDYSFTSFTGEIFIDSDIQDVEAHQKNKNLMLSENCSMSSRPELKIDSDSVKCSHGSTVGQVDEEAIFYMQSRSIDKKLAKKILVESFKNSIIKNIPNRHILEHISELTKRK